MADPGMPVMKEDFGAGDPPPPPPSGGINIDELDGMLAEAQNQLGNPPDGLRYQRPSVPVQPAASAPKAMWVTYALSLASMVSWTDQVREKAGIAWDYMQQVREGLKAGNVTPPIDPPPPPPPPPPPVVTPKLYGVAVSYAGHDPARDSYLGYTDDQVAWGQHDSLELRAPAPGTVRLYTSPTPLGTMDAATQAVYKALFTGWVCSLPEDVLTQLGQTMNIMVYVPDVPIQTSYGRLVAGWAAHVRNGVQNQHVNTGDVMALSGASGIQFERAGIANARAAHVHTCASSTGQLTPNGDMDGRAFAEALGWGHIEYLGLVGPGPNDYLQGGWTAGRRTSDFTQGGHPIPPIAPD